MATRTIMLTTEEIDLLNDVLNKDHQRNALPIAIEKGWSVSFYVSLAAKIELLCDSTQKEDGYI